MRILFYVEATRPLRPAANVRGRVSHYFEHQHQHEDDNVGDVFEQSKYMMQSTDANNVLQRIHYRTVVHCETPTKVWLRSLCATAVTGKREMVYALPMHISEPEQAVSFLQNKLPPFLKAHLHSPCMKVLCMPDEIRVRFIDALSEEEWCERGGMQVRFSVWALVAPVAVTPAGAIMHQQPGYAIHAQAPIRAWLTDTWRGLQVDETAFVYEVYIPMEQLNAAGDGSMTREQKVKEVLRQTIPPGLMAHLITPAMRVEFNYPCTFSAHFTHAAPDPDLRIG